MTEFRAAHEGVVGPTSFPNFRTTARLQLRRIDVSDVPKLAALISDPAVNRYRAGGPRALESSEELVRAFVQAWEANGVCYWTVEFEGDVVGVAGVEPWDWAEQRCWNLYYLLSSRVWGRGLATEAAVEAVAVARELQPTWPVVARVRPANHASARVASRAGLERRPDLDHDGFDVFVNGWPAEA